MNKRQEIFFAGLLCAITAFVASAYISLPNFKEGILEGELLHPRFGPVEFVEVFILTVLLCLVLARILFRPGSLLTGLVFGAGFGLFSLALLILEARLQHHGAIVEAVIKGRYGPKWVILIGAAVMGCVGLAIARISIREKASRPARREQPFAKRKKGKAKTASAKKKISKKKAAKKKRTTKSARR